MMNKTLDRVMIIVIIVIGVLGIAYAAQAKPSIEGYWEHELNAECNLYRDHSGRVPGQYDVAVFIEDGYDARVERVGDGINVPPPEGRRSWDIVLKCKDRPPTTTTTTVPPSTTTTTTTKPPPTTTIPDTTTTTDPGTTTTTVVVTTTVPTPTTTLPDTTTSLPVTTTTVPPTTTSVAPVTTTVVVTTTLPPELPKTGAPLGVLAAMGLGLFVLGAATLVGAKGKQT